MTAQHQRGEAAYVNPVVAVSLGSLILGEPLTLATVLGAARSSWPSRCRSPRKDTEMIARIWRGAVRADDAAAYASYIQQTEIDGYRRTPGNRGAWVLWRAQGDRAEFVTLSFWESRRAIQGSAGEDIEKAVFYPEDDRFLVERDLTVRHYEIAGTQ